VTVEATSALLEQVFPSSPRISRVPYLRWLYEDSPFGEVIQANLDDELGRAGHYAVVPIKLIADGSPQAGALSLNTAVHERARGGGVFVSLATDVIEQARKRGVEALIGVGNASSTPGFEHRLGFEVVTALPATVMVPTPGPTRGVRSAWSDPAAFEPGGLVAGAGGLLGQPAAGTVRAWDEQTLRWRLESPGSRYALHRLDDALVVTQADRRFGTPVAVLMKVFAAAPLSGATRRAIVRATCRLHRAPLALHAGLNDMVRFEGLPLPKRLRSSPLNLVYRRLDGEARPGPITRFEFLDFDAY
jgi:GNAT superfamily N-acetyltransferase